MNEDIVIVFEAADLISADHYASNHGCLLATALTRMGYSEFCVMEMGRVIFRKAFYGPKSTPFSAQLCGGVRDLKLKTHQYDSKMIGYQLVLTFLRKPTANELECLRAVDAVTAAP